MNKKKKKLNLKSLKSKKYRIYGIYNFETDKMIFVTMDMDDAMFEFELNGYDPEVYDIVSFQVLLT